MSIDISKLQLGDVIVASDHPFVVFRIAADLRYLANTCSNRSTTGDSCIHARVCVWTIRTGSSGMLVPNMYTLIPADS